MASPDSHHQHLHPQTDSAVQEAQTWIEAVTGRCLGDRDFRAALENGILLCELLSAIKPGLVKKINRLPTPIAGLDNLSVFLRGCEDLGLKASQLFDPGDLQDSSSRCASRGSDCSRKLKNVLVTIYWLGRAANSCTSYSGPTLELKEFDGLLSLMRKEADEAESPKRSIRDSGYIDCWDSERSDSLSPPRHGREDSFDSLDSFGSRSRQTPSPDVLVARGSSDGRGSDSESDGPPHRKVPDIRKDDMLARRTSVTELRTAMPFNQYLPNKSNQSGYVPTPLRKKRSDAEDGGRRSWSTATSPVGGDRPFSTPSRSCSEELFHHAAAAAAAGTEDAALRKEAAGDDKRPPSPKRVADVSPSDFLPLPAATDRRKERALSEREGGAAPSDRSLPAKESDDAKSVSMIDMRGEEEGVLPPHSHVRHALMHSQYSRLKEEEDHWQDDLVRWKNRRRSVSQDLIKKEEERKMMEQLMSGGGCVSQRRRSIKTYREIVEDKERREEELRLAYRSAGTPEEASAILQRYAQRFSISEAVLERLQLPKLLDRSVSADPAVPLSVPLSASPPAPGPFHPDADGPLRYLRQQSAPAPRFTSTLEARVEEFASSSHHRPQIRSRSTEPPSTRTLSPKPVPLLTPKPYLTRPAADADAAAAAAADPHNAKVDGLLRVNGDAGGDHVPASPRSPEKESPPTFQASPSKSAAGSGDAPPLCTAATPPPAGRAGPESARAEESPGAAAEDSAPPARPTSLPADLQKPPPLRPSAAGDFSSSQLLQHLDPPTNQEEQQTERSGGGAPQHQQSASCPQTAVMPPDSSAASSLGLHPHTDSELSVSSPPPPASSPQLRWEFFAPSENPEKDGRGNVSVPVLPQARRPDRWSWDPDEERKRQERWQQEQERMLQEKYRREQEKLREEWEKAQREVAEEGRKYHEEERRILEETVAPLTPRSSALPSPSRGELSASEPRDAIVRSLADWERKQELLERQTRESAGGAEAKPGARRENDRTSDISTADDSMKTGRSLMSMSSSQAETAAHSLDGQKPPAAGGPSSTPPPSSQQEATGDSGRSRRSPCPPPAAASEPPAPNRSVSGKKLCSSCGQPLGKGAAMIIETLSLYFHIHCFKCGVCKGQLGDTTTGTDVRIRNGLLNCHQCYIRSRSAGQPTTL